MDMPATHFGIASSSWCHLTGLGLLHHVQMKAIAKIHIARSLINFLDG